MSQHRTALTLDEKESLYRDGFVVVRGAVPPELVAAAVARIERATKGDGLATDSALTDLVNRTCITPIMREAMGEFDPVTMCQPGIHARRDPGDFFMPTGYRDRELPYYGAEVHMDGAITIAPPQQPMEGTPDEIYRAYFASGPRGDLGRSAEVIGHNMTPMFQDPAMTLGLGSFTSFLFVCLNDQLVEGCGQTAVIPGSHHAVERFFRWQRSVNGHIGPEGPGWPRLRHDVPNRCGLIYAPDEVMAQFIDDTSECTPDGRRWPRPTQVMMRAGDVAIATYHILHTVTRNERGTESRKNIIFRLRNKRRQPEVVLTGVSDHPDRGWDGEFLNYSAGNDPWERSKDAMCDIWSEWDGIDPARWCHEA